MELTKKEKEFITNYNNEYFSNIIELYKEDLLVSIALGALLNCIHDARFNHISPTIETTIIPFTPGRIYDWELLSMLYDKKVIAPSSKSPKEAFSKINIEKGTYSFFLEKAFYSINPNICFLEGSLEYLSNGNEFRKIVLLDGNKYKLYDGHHFGVMLLDIWVLIGVMECWDYFKYRVTDIFEENIDDIRGKMAVLFQELLKNMSVAEVFRIIYKKTQQASELVVSGKTKKNKVGGVTYELMLNYYKCWIRKDYFDLYAFNRPEYKCPESMLSLYFFNTVLNIGDEGFYHTPRKVVSEEIRCIDFINRKGLPDTAQNNKEYEDTAKTNF